ncbi:UDP-2,4-diacetamido-2,4,6-trideoxy-beta-L-altropyranose hydrolase [Halobacteriovorax sp. RT-2-6]|uniref:UDP-2,4-diacetamido-2,4, 6-trideoxy-beta-L-altropyranose hydrolase n=1 Tax=unclassified Halobacteriovorax TaxID=2639665 RepID=UPI00399B0632
MKVLFYTNSSIEIGYGHLMRCVNLAQEFYNVGFEVIFLTEDRVGSLINKIPSNFLVLECSEGVDSGYICDLIKKYEPTHFVSDSYDLDLRFDQAIQKIEGLTYIVIDDLGREHDCDFLIDQNIDANLEKYSSSLCKNYILGLDYVILNSSFDVSRNQYRDKYSIENVLVFFSGGDTFDCEKMLIEAISQIDLDLKFTLITKHMHNISNNKLDIVGFVNDIAHFMLNFDYMIGACGSMTWERFCLGLPSSLISLADNQVGTAKILDAMGLIRYLGDIKNLNVQSWKNELVYLNRSKTEFFDNSREIFDLVDGNGTKRIVKKILDYK